MLLSSPEMALLVPQGRNKMGKAVLFRPLQVFVPAQLPLPVVRMHPFREDQRLRDLFDRAIFTLLPCSFQNPEDFVPFFGSRTNEFPHRVTPIFRLLTACQTST